VGPFALRRVLAGCLPAIEEPVDLTGLSLRRAFSITCRLCWLLRVGLR
jgi:hypothetical protein